MLLLNKLVEKALSSLQYLDNDECMKRHYNFPRTVTRNLFGDF